MWLSYRRLSGIERGLWAVVSQLQALRREEAAAPTKPDDPVQTFVRSGVQRISNSQFGR
jgi:hypothetical protein